MESSPKFPATQPSTGSAFRSSKKSARLHHSEIALIALIGAHLCFLPWAFGGMYAWAQWTSLGFSLTTLVVALTPRTHTEDFSTDGRIYRYSPSKRLLSFPGFWLGLAVLLYVIIQGLNPAWTYVHSNGQWWMEEKGHVTWLPSGAAAPFSNSNPWRTLLVWSSAWLLGCSLWIGLTRRASLRALLIVITANATVLALVGILQQVAGNGKVLWFIPAPTYYTVATFPYKNHAGAFFNLLLAATAALTLWYHRRAERRLERSSPAPLFALCTVPLALIVALSFSRAATVLMLGFVLLALVLGALSMIRSARRPSLLLVSLFAAGLVTLVAVSAHQLQLEKVSDSFQKLFTTDRAWSVEARQLAAQATGEMAADQLATGWGAGCFRYLFPLYQQHHPQISQPSSNSSASFHFEHAHNDYLEFLAELGIIGCTPIILLIALWMLRLIRARFWANPPLLFLVIGILVLLGHCWIDFHLRSPAILLSVIALAAVSARWCDLESRQRPA